MKDLLPDQIDFLRKHLNYDAARYLRKRQLQSQIQEFWRRREKVEQNIAILPPGHPQLAALKKAVNDATKTAENDIKAAYTSLANVKALAKAAAASTRDGISVAAIEGDLSYLEGLMTRLHTEQENIQDFADRTSRGLITRAANMIDPGTSKGHEAIVARMSENHRIRTELNTEWDTMQDAVTQRLQNYKTMAKTMPTVKHLMDVIVHNNTLLMKAQPETARMGHNARMVSAESRIKTHLLETDGGQLRSDVSALIKARREDFLSKLREKTTPPAVEPAMFTDNTGAALDPAAAKLKAAEMAERFKLVEIEEKKRLETAKQMYLEAIKTDAAFLKITEDTSLIRSTELRALDTSDFLEDIGVDVTDTRKTPDDLAKTAGNALVLKIAEFQSAAVGPRVPDEIFEMAARSQNDWYLEAAKSAGIRFDPDKPETIDPTVWAKIKAVGDKMAEVARDSYPNTSKFTDGKLEEIVIGGVTYSEFVKLAQGGGGEIWKGLEPGSGEEIILKMPLEFDPKKNATEEKHHEFASEAANHRAACGGEFDPCPANVLEMKAMVLAPNGVPLIAMDLAESGDAENYSHATDAAEHSGLLSPKARQAMNAKAMQDMCKGLMAMQAAGMTHHDLKEANVFIGADGSFKLADFGLARHVESHDGSAGDVLNLTAGYEPREFFSAGDVTQKSDNFTLGNILSKMSDPYGGYGTIASGIVLNNPSLDQRRDTDGEVTSASSLDRLVNALLDPDPAKRPTMEAALKSSFLSEVDQSFGKVEIDQLRKATADYAAKVGSKLMAPSRDLKAAEIDIVALEMRKSDAQLYAEIEHYERLMVERTAGIEDATRRMNSTWDEKVKAELAKKIKAFQQSLNSAAGQKDRAIKKLGAPKTEVELDEIDKAIAKKRAQVIDLKKQIDAINNDPANKAVIEALERANKPFV